MNRNTIYKDKSSPIASAVERVHKNATNTNTKQSSLTKDIQNIKLSQGTSKNSINKDKNNTNINNKSQSLETFKDKSDTIVIKQDTKVHSYFPPCLRSIIKSLEYKHQNGHVYLEQQSEKWDDPTGEEPLPDEEEFEPFIFIKYLPRLNVIVSSVRKSPLPVKSKFSPPITLALDLDETLVHCSIQAIELPEFTFCVNFNGADYEVYVRIRPHLEYFLRQVSQWFEVIVFTASQKVYADNLLNIIDPRNEFIVHRLFRDSCIYVDGNYLKDLNILGRSLDKVVIVDNSFQAFGYNIDNGIPIESWFNDENDCELLKLVPFLRHLKDVNDVRPYIRQAFHLREFVDAIVPRFG